MCHRTAPYSTWDQQDNRIGIDLQIRHIWDNQCRSDRHWDKLVRLWHHHNTLAECLFGTNLPTQKSMAYEQVHHSLEEFKGHSFCIWSMSAEPCPSCNIHEHLAIHRLHRGNYSKDLPDSRTGIVLWNVIWPEVKQEVVDDLPVLVALNELITWSLIGQMGWQV